MTLSPTAFDAIRKAVHGLCGVVITGDKEYLVKARLEPVLRRNGLPSYEAFLKRLDEPGSLLLRDQTVEAITTKETSFNRDGHPFDELRRSVLPGLARRLIERKAAAHPAQVKCRVWCAAVATGQEAYSVAMAVSAFVAGPGAGFLTVDDFPILATDISALALAAAGEGRYTLAELGRGVTPAQRERYFREDGGAWAVDASLRRMIEFRRLNLTAALPNVGTFDLILCRNLLIYLDQEARRRLCQALHAALNPRGVLMIGAAESLYGTTDDFTTERLGNTVVYRKD